MNPENNQKQSLILLKIVRHIALVSAIFTMILMILLTASFIQQRTVDPLKSEALNTLMVRLQENPEDVELKEQIRALDLLARKSYFTYQWQIKTGNIMLFCFGLILVISLKYIHSLKLQLPDLSKSSDEEMTWESKLMARKYILYGGAAIFILVMLLGIFSDRAARSIDFSNEMAIAQSDNAESDLLFFEDMRKHWPSFRGAEGLGITYNQSPLTQWDGESGENILWKVPVPLTGFNSPIIWGEKLFLSGGDKDHLEVYCYHAMSGEMLWKGDVNDVSGASAEIQTPSDDTGYAAATMSTDGELVFAIFATGDLAAWDMDGNRVWAKNVGIPDNHYGHSSSLMNYQDLLLVQFDHNKDRHLFAFQSKSGKQVYDVKRDNDISWASPILVHTGDRTELILNSNPFVTSYDPRTGKELWKVDCMSGEVAPSPAYIDGMVYAVNDYARLVGIQIGNPAELIWEYEDDLSEVSSPVAYEQYLIVPTSWGTVSCFNNRTGERFWYHDFDDPFYASPIMIEDLVYLPDMEGNVQIFKASETFELVNTCVMGEAVVATPAFMHQKIYIRTYDNLFCIGNGE